MVIDRETGERIRSFLPVQANHLPRAPLPLGRPWTAPTGHRARRALLGGLGDLAPWCLWSVLALLVWIHVQLVENAPIRPG